MLFMFDADQTVSTFTEELNVEHVYGTDTDPLA